jgi:hypothetical protein
MKAVLAALLFAALAVSGATADRGRVDPAVKIPRCVDVHWLNKRKTHGWALTPYYSGATRRNHCALVGRRERLCGWKVYGTDRSSWRVCETFDGAKHWRIVFTNHTSRGDDVTIQDGPISGTNYFDQIDAFWRSKGIKYVSGSKGQCHWTVRSFNKGRNWRNVDGTQDCGPGP